MDGYGYNFIHNTCNKSLQVVCVYNGRGATLYEVDDTHRRSIKDGVALSDVVHLDAALSPSISSPTPTPAHPTPDRPLTHTRPRAALPRAEPPLQPQHLSASTSPTFGVPLSRVSTAPPRHASPDIVPQRSMSEQERQLARANKLMKMGLAAYDSFSPRAHSPYGHARNGAGGSGGGGAGGASTAREKGRMAKLKKRISSREGNGMSVVNRERLAREAAEREFVKVRKRPGS
ncbi:hypothetical protein NUW54_g8501 [Trametes sanguinea]|uniref:Uncharacterized protein n=1 Tax=Trametes sanguinea TaxID=158606 RepID=A0ACC1PCZ3_9APHY|nr:hypothetical protein NUW54_g8501 [Trametes sanguinea]